MADLTDHRLAPPLTGDAGDDPELDPEESAQLVESADELVDDDPEARARSASATP